MEKEDLEGPSPRLAVSLGRSDKVLQDHAIQLVSWDLGISVVLTGDDSGRSLLCDQRLSASPIAV